MKNILYIAPGINVKGGISTVIRGYLGTDLRTIFHIHLVESYREGPNSRKIIQALIGLLQALKCLLLERVEIVHIHGGDINSVRRKYAYFRMIKLFKFKCRVIYHFHGASFLEQFRNVSTFWKKQIGKFFEDVDLLICLSDAWAGALRNIAPGAKIKIVKNSVLLPPLHDRQKNGATFRILFLGLIGGRKGIFDLLKAVQQLKSEGHDIRLKIGGNGEVEELKEKIRCFGIHEAVVYLGWISDEVRKDALFKEADLFVLPSYGEGMPMAIVEAMSYGIPVISTPVGGIPELVAEGRTGFLVQPGDVGALTAKIKELILNEKLRIDLGANARTAIEQNFDLNKTVQDMVTIYNAL